MVKQALPNRQRKYLLKDESKASTNYSKISNRFRAQGNIPAATAFKKMAGDEARHHKTIASLK